MANGILWAVVFYSVIILGFAYIIWIMANKESGLVKMIGQILAAIIAIMVIIGFIYGVSLSGRMAGMKGMCGPDMMGPGMGSGMMKYKMMDPEKMQQKMEMQKEMMKKMPKVKK